MAEKEPVIQKRYVGVKETLIYGVANGGQCLSYTFMASYLSYFFVNVFDIEPAAVASMIFILGIWDTINDPIMGTFMDKTRTRFGKMRPWLLFVPIPLAIFTTLLFAGPMFFQGEPSTSIKKIVYMYISYVIWELFYTIGDVPFWGMSASISPNPADRTRVITSARFISGIIGGLPGIVIAPVIDLAKGGSINVSMQQIFFVLGIAVSVIGMGLFSMAGVFCKERVVQSVEEPSMLESLKFMVKNKPLMLILLSNVLGCFGGIYDIFTNYLFIDVMGSATLGLIVGIPGTVAGFLAYLFIPFFKKHWNNKQIMILTTFIQSGAAVLTYFIGMRYLHNMAIMVPLLMARGVFWNIVSGVRMVVPTEMVGDTVDYMEWKTGQRSEGMSFSVLTFVGKFSGSMQKSFGTLALTWIGYVSTSTGNQVVQSVSTQNGIWAFYTIIPALLALLGLIPLLFYDLEGKKLSGIRADLIARREKLSEEISQDGGAAPAGEAE